MTKTFRALLLLLLAPTASLPQRYGRPYNFAEKPQLLLEIKVHAKSQYFRASSLRSMQRSVATQTDPVTNVSHTYEGVGLEQLIPALTTASPAQSLQIEYGAHHSIIDVSLAELDSQVKPMVVDKVDGRELDGYTPFYFLVKQRGRPAAAISDVERITLTSS